MPLNPDCASLGVYDIYRICFLFWVSESKRRRAAKKHKGGRARRESSALICWHGNTDFFVSPRRERRQRILGITGMMTGGKHAQTDTETGARLSHIKIQGRSNNLPSRNERGGFTPSLSFSQFYYKHLYKSYVLPFISLVVFFLFFSRPNFFLPFVSVWQLGQPEKSGLHYVGQTFATVGRQPAFLATSSQGRRGQTTRWGGLNWKETKTKVGERRQNSERASHNKAAIFLLGST